MVCGLNAGTRLRVTLNDGDDFASVGAGIVPTTLDGGTGNDNLSSDSGSDTLIGGAEDDVLSDDGNAGNDVFDGGAGKSRSDGEGRISHVGLLLEHVAVSSVRSASSPDLSSQQPLETLIPTAES